MFRRTKVSASVMALVGGALLGTSGAALAQQRIEITGSNIKRIDVETVAPVQIITREEIERTGQPTIAEVMRALPTNLGSYSEVFSNSFAPGAAGISLRGLGQKSTLVLINGRRTAGYGFAQNISDSFVDVNAIPSSAVERIEILKDGASAIYGSDAIAGVVNVIMRRDYRGLELSVSGGEASGKNDYKATATYGFGDLAKDKYNVFGSLDIYKRDLVLQSDAEFTKDRDFRGKYDGGRNFQSLTAGGTWQQVRLSNPATGSVLSTAAVDQKYQSITECKGTRMTGPQAVEAGLINLTPTTQSAGNLAILNARAAATNSFCTFNFASQLPALPETNRVNGYVRGAFEVSPTVSAYTEVGLSSTETFQVFTSPFFQTTGLTQTAQGLRPFTFQQNYAPGAAGNPFTTGIARFSGNLISEGTRDNVIKSDAFRVLAGAVYSLGSWDLDSAAGYAQTKSTTDNLNRVTLSGTAGLLGISTAPQPPTPTVTSSAYNYDKPSTNAAGTYARARVDFDRAATSELEFLDTKASTTFGKLPGGPIGLAVGAEYRRESIRDRPADVAKRGDVLGQGIVDVDGSRSNVSAFAEVSAPIFKNAEVQLAGRYDKYSDYGTSTTPKVGIKFRPMDKLLVRANWGKGFRAPTLPEISNSVATYFSTVFDPQVGAVVQFSGVFAGNANLKPETSESATLGFVFEPTKNVNVGVNFFDIKWKNVVDAPSAQEVVDRSCPSGPPCPSTANVIRDPSTNIVSTIISNWVNLAERTTRGVDIDGSVTFKADTVSVRLAGDLTYIDSFKEDGFEVAGTSFGSYTVPKLRSSFSTTLETGPFSYTFRARYTGGYTNYLTLFPLTSASGSYFLSQDPRFQTGVLPPKVSSSMTFDLFARYQFNKRFTGTVGLINLTNEMPPYDPAFGNFTDTQLYDLRGRQVRLTLRYTM